MPEISKLIFHSHLRNSIYLILLYYFSKLFMLAQLLVVGLRTQPIQSHFYEICIFPLLRQLIRASSFILIIKQQLHTRTVTVGVKQSSFTKFCIKLS